MDLPITLNDYGLRKLQLCLEPNVSGLKKKQDIGIALKLWGMCSNDPICAVDCIRPQTLDIKIGIIPHAWF